MEGKSHGIRNARDRQCLCMKVYQTSAIGVVMSLMMTRIVSYGSATRALYRSKNNSLALGSGRLSLILQEGQLLKYKAMITWGF